MGNDRQHAPQSAQTAPVASNANADALDHEAHPVELDSARAISLVLQDATAEAERAYSTRGIGQAIAALERIDDVLDNVAALVKLHAPAAGMLQPMMAATRQTAARLASLLAVDPTLSAMAADVIAKLDRIEPNAIAVPQAIVPTALTPAQKTELFRQELAATRAQVDLVVASRPTSAEQAAQLCEPLRTHLQEARHAVLGFDRFSREPMYADVDAISRDLDRIEQVLIVDPRFEWKTEFASAFDAENRLRGSVGLPAKARAYSGMVDPAAARRAVIATSGAAARGDRIQAMDSANASPQASINQITNHLAGAYEQMLGTMNQFALDYSKEDPPSLSVGDAIFNAVLGTLLDFASAGVASFLGNGLANALVGVPVTELGKEAEGAIGSSVTNAMIEQHKLRHTLAKDAANKGIGSLFKAGTSKLKITASQATSFTLLSRFVELALRNVGMDKVALLDNIALLTDPLSQLDPHILQSLAAETNGLSQAAVAAISERAFIEWEKLKTANALPERPGKEPLIEPQRESEWHDRDIDGVLEIGLDVSRRNAVAFSYLRLMGNEPAGRYQLRHSARAVGQVPIHKQFHVCFASARLPPELAPFIESRDFITFGVGANEGLQLDTLDEREWLWIRLFAGGESVDQLSALALQFKDRDGEGALTPENAGEKTKAALERHLSRGAAIAALKSLVAFGDNLTTDKVEP